MIKSKIEVPRDVQNSKGPYTCQVQERMVSTLEKNAQMGQDQVSVGVSVLYRLSTSVAMFYGSLQNLVIRSKSVIKTSSVISSQICVMSDQLRVSLNMVISQNIKYHLGEGDFKKFDEIPISTIKLPEGRFQTFHNKSLSEKLR